MILQEPGLVFWGQTLQTFTGPFTVIYLLLPVHLVVVLRLAGSLVSAIVPRAQIGDHAGVNGRQMRPISAGRHKRNGSFCENAAQGCALCHSFSTTKVDPSEIKGLRCDGVVEYVYEWYDYRICGNDTYWDVTKSSFLGQDAHSGNAVTPKSQAGFMTRITTDLPS
ncbi:MAG: hypothetical protein ACOH1Y_03870 [Propionicimonas sp.]